MTASPHPVFNTRAACSSLPPDASSVRATVQAPFAATKSHNTRCCSRRLRPHDGKDNRNRSQRRLEQTLASLRDASPAWSGQPPSGTALLFFFEKRSHRFCRNLFRQSIYFPARSTEPCTTPFCGSGNCRFPTQRQLVVAHQEPGAVSGGRSQAV